MMKFSLILRKILIALLGVVAVVSNNNDLFTSAYSFSLANATSNHAQAAIAGQRFSSDSSSLYRDTASDHPPLSTEPQRRRLQSSSGFYLVDTGANNTLLGELADGSQVEIGDFSFTFETLDTEGVASVDFTVTMEGQVNENGGYGVPGSTFFDMASAISQTPGSYTLSANATNGVGQVISSSSVAFEVIYPLPSEAPSVAPSSLPSSLPSLAPSASAAPSSSPSDFPTTSQPDFDPIRLMCGTTGGAPYVDTFFREWGLDQYFVGGATYGTGAGIAETEDDKIYQTERWSKNADSVKYEIPLLVDVVMVDVILHFCELYHDSPGDRVFDITLEGNVVKTGQDTLAETGGKNTAMFVTFPYVEVLDGFLTIELIDNVENANIMGIEVLPPGTAGQLSQPDVFIHSGSTTTYTDINNQVWGIDRFNSDKGFVATVGTVVEGTLNSPLFQSYRFGLGIEYKIPVVETGDYLVTLYFMEPIVTQVGQRWFSVFIEGQDVLGQFDIFDEAGGQFIALEKEIPVSVVDGEVTINFNSIIGEPIISAVKVNRLGPHYAHSVPGGPYFAVDEDGGGDESITVNGFQSHTHLEGAQLVSWEWSTNGVVIGTGEEAVFTLPVGVHIVNLFVVDDAGNTANEITTITILAQGFPVVNGISPNSGQIEGNELVTLTGSGFTDSDSGQPYDPSDIVITFGTTQVTGPAIVVNSDTSLSVVTPPFGVAIPVDVSVTTPKGTSNSLPYTYVSQQGAIAFSYGELYGLGGPTAIAFGANGKLYIATQFGSVVRLTLDEDYNIVEELVSQAVPTNNDGDPFRAILGIAVDPFDTSEHPAVYVAHAWLFHGSASSFEDYASTNGKVSKLSGENLEVYEDVVTGLPVSDHDHGINGLEFDDLKNLYIQVGGNTNAGVPGALSSSKLQKENYFSAATIWAHLGNENFNGMITYNVTGIPEGDDVEVFSSGQRNPYDLFLHSNGYLYATDNGPNNNFGKKSTSCTTDAGDPTEADELNRLEFGGFYGHANRARGELDPILFPTECTWRSLNEPSDADYTGPMETVPSSTNGIIEFQTAHFGGQMRGDLILSKFKGKLFRLVLDADGESVAAKADLVDQGGLHLAQAPDGTIFVAQYNNNKIIYHKPSEPAAATITIKAVWPRRGPVAGGHKLTIYGELLTVQGPPAVSVGGKVCTIVSSSASKIECTLPAGTTTETVDVAVSTGPLTAVLSGGYRYMMGPGVPGTISPAPSTSVAPSLWPSSAPSVSMSPSSAPSVYPTTSTVPSILPSSAPSAYPTASAAPTLSPSSPPSSFPTTSNVPTNFPSSNPSASPTGSPTPAPSALPTESLSPSLYPSATPSVSIAPSNVPSANPSLVPSALPSVSAAPSTLPSAAPSSFPTTSNVPTAMEVFDPILINVGGGSLLDPDGRTWIADVEGEYTTDGDTYSTSSGISGTNFPALYKDERYSLGSTQPGITYNVPVPNGVYVVTLHFAEIYFTKNGERVFDISIEGVLKISGFDPHQVAGGKNKAHVEVFSGISVADGILTITLTNVKQNANIMGIEIDV